MNKIIAWVDCLLIFALVAFITVMAFNLYPAAFTVVEVNRAANCITLEDPNGNLWEYDGAEDWMVGDTAAAIMFSNLTESIYDDTIIQLRYQG